MSSSFRFALAALALAWAVVAEAAAPDRRIVLQPSPDIPEAAVSELAEGARSGGLEVRVAREGEPVEPGFVLLRVSTLPASETVRTAILVFPIQVDGTGFVFDGKPYRRADEAVRLTTSTRGEIIVLGNSREAALALAARWLAAPGTADYEVISGEVSRDGRFERREGRLFVDKATDRDRIAQRDAFLASLKRRTRGTVTWEYPESAEPAAAKWEKVLARFVGKGPARGGGKGGSKGKQQDKGALTVRVYPDAVTKAILTGSARPADIDPGDQLRVDLDASAPDQPDLITPVLASAGLALANPALRRRPVVLAAAGARLAGTWWGRDVKTFGAFMRAAGVDPSIADVLTGAESVSPVLDVGAVASWLDAGARLESEASVSKALTQPDAALATTLAKWRAAAQRQSVKPPAARPLPEGFLRGVTYPAPETVEDGFISKASREAIARLASDGFGSIALRPGALMRDAQSRRILFVRHGARGETDEGILHALLDAHAVKMTAMVAPEVLIGDGTPVARIDLSGEAAWSEWFSAYRRFLVHEAVVAEAGGADLLVVGAGLTSTELEKNEWKQAIAAARLATGAALVYSVAHPGGAVDVPFWDALDAMGVELMEPLPRGEKASDAALSEAARSQVLPLAEAVRRSPGKPVLVTRASTEDPRAVGARVRALTGAPWWRGIYWARFEGPEAAAAEKAVLDAFRSVGENAP